MDEQFPLDPNQVKQPQEKHVQQTVEAREPAEGLVGAPPVLNKVKKPQSKKRKWIIVGLTFLVLIIVGICIKGLVAFYATPKNKAQTAIKPILTSIEALGGKQICSEGDPGAGFDENTQPWYEAYYSVSDNKLEATIKSASKANGYTLTTDTGTITDLKQKGSDTYVLQGAAPYNSQSSYLSSTSDQNGNLTVLIDRNGPMLIHCAKVPQQTASGSTDIVSVQLYLPVSQ